MEIWKCIKGYKWLYKVSNFWRIKALWKYANNNWWKQFRKPRILKFHKTKEWYCRIGLCKNAIQIKYLVHCLVLENFLWESELECNHKNWIKHDNKLENLEWVTKSENQLHRYHVLKKY